jgi:predicted RND superfamily exporter protein
MVCDVCIYMSLICVWLINKVIDFKFPDKGELERISNKERLNIFRRYFAASRYNRLLIQKNLIKSAYNESSPSEILELERSHNQDFFDKVRVVKEYGILDEFIDAAKEEEYGLQKIIEAYDKRIMNESLS